jgi:hypothetical protein
LRELPRLVSDSATRRSVPVVGPGSAEKPNVNVPVETGVTVVLSLQVTFTQKPCSVSACRLPALASTKRASTMKIEEIEVKVLCILFSRGSPTEARLLRL